MENVSRNHYDLSDIEMYLRFKEFPKGLIPANRSNFRRGCKKFSTVKPLNSGHAE